MADSLESPGCFQDISHAHYSMLLVLSTIYVGSHYIIFTQTTVTITNVCNESIACNIIAKPRVEWSCLQYACTVK